MLRKKAMRDIKQNLSSFITIFLMVFLGVLVFAGIHCYMDGMSESADTFYSENNLQDIWVEGDELTLDDVEAIEKLDCVNKAETSLIVKCNLENYEDVIIETNIIEENDISKMYVVEGEGFDQTKEGIWFDSYLADYLKIKVGDELTLSCGDYTIKGPVLGLVNTPDHVYFVKDSSAIFPTHDDYGFAYVSTKLSPAEGYFTNIYVDLKENADVEVAKAEIQVAAKNADAVIDRAANPSYETYLGECEEGQTYSVIFTALFLFIAILSVVTTMHRFVKKQRTQIGTLKALGVGRKKITRHYVGFGFFISLAAALLGVIVGKYSIGKMFIEMEEACFEVPNMKMVTIPMVYIVAIAIVLVITFVTYLTCKGILKESAASALRLEVPKVKSGSVKPAKGITKKMSVGVRWNIRDIKRNKGRTITAIVGIVGCTMLVVCALGMKSTMNFFIDWQFESLYKFDYKLEIDREITDETLQNLFDEYGDETTMTLYVEAQDSKGVKSTRTIIVNDAPDFYTYTDHNAKIKSIDDSGMYATEKLLEILGLEVGDEITWSAYGDDKIYTTKVVGTYREPGDQTMAMTKEYAESIGLTYRADSIYTEKDLSGVKEIEGVSLIQNKEKLKDGMLSMIDMMNMLIVLLIVVSVILAFVIIYNLGILSFSEKQYQFATMKVLGFNAKRIKKIYIMQNIWISLIAIIIGLPLGYGMTKMIFTMALNEKYDMMVNIPVLLYSISAIGTFAVAYIINRFLSSKIKTIDMVTSLKANE